MVQILEDRPGPSLRLLPPALLRTGNDPAFLHIKTLETPKSYDNSQPVRNFFKKPRFQAKNRTVYMLFTLNYITLTAVTSPIVP